MKILHSTIKGSGNPLLILHGYFGMSDNWKTLATKFAQQFEVHLIDQRNHGRSFHDDVFNYEVLVSDLYHYITHHQLERVALLGHSMGGKTAMLFATTYPKLINKLLIADISPRKYEPHHQVILAGLNAIDFHIHTSRKLVEEQLAAYIPEIGVRQFLLKNVYWKEKEQLDFRFNLKSLTENNFRIGDALPSHLTFSGETLFLKGSNSAYITQAEHACIKRHFPNFEIVTISNAGHWLHAENPIDFYNEMVRFLS